MARDRHLPGALATVHPRFQVPHRAELAVGVVVAVAAATVDLRSAIGFSSFGVLLYYAVANAAALTQRDDERTTPRVQTLQPHGRPCDADREHRGGPEPDDIGKREHDPDRREDRTRAQQDHAACREPHAREAA
jgi:hypothetical protein